MNSSPLSPLPLVSQGHQTKGFLLVKGYAMPPDLHDLSCWNCSYYRWRKRSTERLCNLPRVTQLVSKPGLFNIKKLIRFMPTLGPFSLTRTASLLGKHKNKKFQVLFDFSSLTIFKPVPWPPTPAHIQPIIILSGSSTESFFLSSHCGLTQHLDPGWRFLICFWEAHSFLVVLCRVYIAQWWAGWTLEPDHCCEHCPQLLIAGWPQASDGDLSVL